MTAVLPNGREIHPAGNWVPLAPYPFALAVRPDGGQIAIPSIGFPFALNVVSDPAGAKPAVVRMPAAKTRPKIQVHAGLAYSPDGSLLYVATGDSGKIATYQTSDWTLDARFRWMGILDAGPTKPGSWSFAATLVVSADGKTLYALDQGNWRVVILDAATLKRIAEVPTGSYPFGLALSPDGTRLYVTNTGLFEYTTIPGADAEGPGWGPGCIFRRLGTRQRKRARVRWWKASRFPDWEMRTPMRGSSLWTYDVHDREHPAVTAKLRLGAKITEERGGTVGGAAPTGVAAPGDAVLCVAGA